MKKSSTTTYQLVCGMEIHAELKTKSKMFCGCKNDPFEAKSPNIHTCPVCLGMPGGLPIPNLKAIEWTIKVGLALNCKINLFSKFDRKHYFYPDLPKGYQISQYDLPFCYDGYIDTELGRVRIQRIHLEEDTGKLIHKKIQGKNLSLIDFNRSGVPLMEIVSDIDVNSPTQASAYGKKIRQLLRYLDVADCNMQEGGMRLEANISLRKPNQKIPNYKVEVKNINSFKFVEDAIGFEIERQQKILDNNLIPKQETRGWNPNSSTTFAQRSKEDAKDYRYFPDPDIPPIRFTQKQIDKIQASLPEMPDLLLKNWQKLKVDSNFAETIIQSSSKAQLFANVTEILKKSQTTLTAEKISKMLINKKIADWHQLSAKQIIKKATQLTEQKSGDVTATRQAVASVLSNNPDVVTRYQAGETKLFSFLIGQVMKELTTNKDMSLIQKILKESLN